jgi:DnaJ homolog subfamily C member 7
MRLFSKQKPNSPKPTAEAEGSSENPESSGHGKAQPKSVSPTKSPTKKSPTKVSRQRDGASPSPKHSRFDSKAFRLDRKSSQSDPSDIHPLNLPPEERERRRSALVAMSGSQDAMDVDKPSGDSTQSPATPVRLSSEVNSSPIPPPHRSSFDSASGQNNDVDAEASKAAGNKFFKAGDYKKAISEYTKAIEAAPQNATYLSNRSAAYMGAHMYAEALEDAKRSDELEPGNTKVLLRLARIYTALGRPSEALAIYSQMQPPASAKDKAPAVAMESYITQAENALHEGTTGSMALHMLDQAEKGLGFAVDRPRKWKLLRAEAYLKMGNVNALGEAQNVAMSLLRTNNQDPEALVLRGRALYGQGENDKAIQHFRQAINCDPDYREAVKYLRMVQKLDKMKEDGNIAFKAGRYEEAVKLYGEALEIDPTNKGTNSKLLQNRALASIKV